MICFSSVYSLLLILKMVVTIRGLFLNKLPHTYYYHLKRLSVLPKVNTELKKDVNKDAVSCLLKENE